VHKNDIIYKRIKKVITAFNTKSADTIADFIIEVAKLDSIVDTLRYIMVSKTWDTDKEFENDVSYWREKSKILADEAEDALMSLYKEDI